MSKLTAVVAVVAVVLAGVVVSGAVAWAVGGDDPDDRSAGEATAGHVHGADGPSPPATGGEAPDIGAGDTASGHEHGTGGEAPYGRRG